MPFPSPVLPANDQLSLPAELLSLSEIISALTFALDLTEAAVPGHALRSCLIGMRIADTLGLRPSRRSSLYYALLLKDCGCSSNASRMYQIVGGDDRTVKAAAKLCDWTKPHKPDARTVKALWDQVAPGKALPLRTIRMLRIALTQHKNNRTVIELRCNRGADIMRRMEMDTESADAVLHLDEHWDGGGYPCGYRGEEIPFLARICSLAQSLDAFYTEDGAAAAITVARARSGRWFDPELVSIAEALHKNGTLWQQCDPQDLEATRSAVLDLDPRLEASLSQERIDRICHAFADVIDAKSPFTFRHSLGVADVAVEIARELGMSPTRMQWVRRAGLLHDIGKLRVPNSILEKPGKLTAEERTVIELHPGLTQSILERISSFDELAIVAGQHHEKLDGTGYPFGLKGHQMSLESRLMVVADIFAALAEDRPYRKGFEVPRCLQILEEMVPGQLDSTCFEALTAAAKRWEGVSPFTGPQWHLASDGVCGWRPVTTEPAVAFT